MNSVTASFADATTDKSSILVYSECLLHGFVYRDQSARLKLFNIVQYIYSKLCTLDKHINVLHNQYPSAHVIMSYCKEKFLRGKFFLQITSDPQNLQKFYPTKICRYTVSTSGTNC